MTPRCLVYWFSHKLVRVSVLLALLCGALSLLAASNSQQFVTGQAAVAVVGQSTYSENKPGAAADRLGTPSGLDVAGERLIVSDGGVPFSAPNNNRVLIFPSVSALTFGVAATVVIGQPDFTTTASGLSEKSLNRPGGVSTNGAKLAVADVNNNRVLLFNQIPTTNQPAADVVLGQPDFNTNLPSTTQNGLRAPESVFIDGQRLIVADTLNHRVLIYNSIPASNAAKADVVLGHADFNVSADAAASATSLRDPVGVFYDGVRLIVTDLGHNRVLIYNRLPATNNTAADVVVGQADFTHEAAGTDAASLNFPRRAITDGTRLYIADTGNNRVLVYNQIPATNGAAADAVLGQRDFRTATDPDSVDPQRLTSSLLGFPVALAMSNNSLLVADSVHRRVLKFSPGVPLFEPGSVSNAATFGGNGLARPVNVKAEVQADDTSTLPAATYFIKVTAEGGILFESILSEEIPVTIPEKSKIVVTFDEVTGATAYRAYLGLSPGNQSRYYTTATPATGAAIDRTITINTLVVSTVGAPRLEVTPGAIQVLFGHDLAAGAAFAESLPLPTELAGTQVLINGNPAPLFYVSPTQINFQTPFAVTGTSASLVVRSVNASGELVISNAIPVPVSELTPGLFTVSGDGTGTLLAFHADWTPVDAQHPIHPSEVITFFGTGVSQIKEWPASGEASPASEITTTKSVSIQGKDAPVQYAGWAPGMVGVLQFNAQVAADLESNGQNAEVKVFVGSIPGNLTYLPAPRPTGTITVNPADNTVTWSASGFENARVYVSVDGGEEALMAEGTSGTATAGFVQPGHLYTFILRSYVGGTVGNAIATATLDKRPPGGTISVNPADHTVTWSTIGFENARVYVSVDGGAEALMAESPSGTVTAGFVQSGHLYTFILRSYVGGTVGDIIATATLDTR